ncbi:hypothetical protein C9374_013466 [Naegleria lovaniensis]|uniref:Fungal lipase-type domain-containing protein n=1 Tax=Naegleria lovaniensis TaxID=51637 RepID=A0AA88H0L8_NAELO|nr:uncharacterized protein C9374_013466 [Naegleria lovaniensis]KAG2391981.1 hypothetical protein C9374_013466 [Naegleria lovaniensis]
MLLTTLFISGSIPLAYKFICSNNNQTEEHELKEHPIQGKRLSARIRLFSVGKSVDLPSPSAEASNCYVEDIMVAKIVSCKEYKTLFVIGQQIPLQGSMSEFEDHQFQMKMLPSNPTVTFQVPQYVKKSAESVSNKIASILQSNQNPNEIRIIFCGHRNGGAIANYSAFVFAVTNSRKENIFVDTIDCESYVPNNNQNAPTIQSLDEYYRKVIPSEAVRNSLSLFGLFRDAFGTIPGGTVFHWGGLWNLANSPIRAILDKLSNLFNAILNFPSFEEFMKRLLAPDRFCYEVNNLFDALVKAVVPEDHSNVQKTKSICPM